MHEKYKLYFWLGLLLLGFCLLKWEALSLPYFWDELGVYARSGMYLCKHTIGLQPKYLTPELSRGHPLLFPFIVGNGFAVFGKTVWVGHSVALGISLLLLTTVFLFAKKNYGLLTALAIIIVLALQPLFFAQSAMVLPEIFLSLCCFLSLQFYSQKNLWQFSLIALLALLTKETALIIPVSAVLFSVAKIISNRERSHYLSIQNALAILFPILVFGTFLLLQKRQNGWYLFPVHTELMNFQFSEIITAVQLYLKFIFIQQGRWIASLIILSGLLFKFKKGMGNISDFVVLSVLFLCVFLAFSSLNFVMMRYALPAIVLFVILLFDLLHSISAKTVLPVATILVLTALYHKESSSFSYDEDMSYRHQVLSQRKATNYVLKLAASTDTIGADFPAYFGISFPESGYMENPDQPVCYGISSKVNYRYYVFAGNGENDYMIPQDSSLRLVKTFRDGFCEGRVYKKN